ncbi:NAD(P)-binding protein [Trichoderma austrokoningii]
MVHVAVAGGTGHVGRAIVKGLVDSQEHQVYVFTRKPTSVFDHLRAVNIIVISYDDQDEIQNVLDKHKIEVVLSTISPASSEAFDAQVRLIRACDKSESTKRFAPSEFLTDYERDEEYQRLMPMLAFQRNIVKELRSHPNLEWTLFHNGYFMDYFGQPWAPTTMPSEVPFIDIEACQATIPGSGDDLATWTHTTDVAKFVSRAISMKPGTWKEHSWIIGDKASLHEILQAAEKARGTKFTVTYDSVEKLKRGEVTPIPGNKAHAALYSTPEVDAYPLVLSMFAGFGTAIASGHLDVPEGESLNAEFPDVETIKVGEFIEKYWTGRRP